MSLHDSFLSTFVKTRKRILRISIENSILNRRKKNKENKFFFVLYLKTLNTISKVQQCLCMTSSDPYIVKTINKRIRFAHILIWKNVFLYSYKKRKISCCSRFLLTKVYAQNLPEQLLRSQESVEHRLDWFWHGNLGSSVVVFFDGFVFGRSLVCTLY